MSGMHPEMIRAEIKMKGLSLADVAAMAGIGESTLCPAGIFVLTRCGLATDLSFLINFYGLALFAAGGLNNGGVNDGGGCFLYF